MESPRGQPKEPVDDRERTTSLVAEYTLDVPSYQDLLSELPGMWLTLEQIVACDPETVSMTFWVEGGDFDAFETALQRSNSITAVNVLDEQIDGRTLYQVRLPAAETTYRTWIDLGSVLLDGTCTYEGWMLRMRFPNHDALRTYRRHCKEQGIPFSLKTLHEGGSVEKCHGLTKPQYQMLEVAIEGGYFEIPRGITISTLAEHFAISDQAASERMRRGLSNVFNNSTLNPANS